MEKLFESTTIIIDNKKYRFNISTASSTKGYIKNIDYGYGVSFSKIENEIKKNFFQGYEDNQSGKSKETVFSVSLGINDINTIKHLKSVFKQAYDYGYKKSQGEKKQKHYIDDLNIQNPILESKLKLLIDDIFNQGYFDGKNKKRKKTKIETEEDFYVINNINELLLKIYNDGYEEGKQLLESKYSFKLPKIDDEILEQNIEKEIISAHANGVDDYDKNKEIKDQYIVNLNFIDDQLLRTQISQLINQAYVDGYNFKRKKIESALNKKKKLEKIKDVEEIELYDLIKKYGKPQEKKFTSVLYQYIIQKDQFKVKNDYKFINIKSDNQFILSQIEKIINEAYSKGKEDASNGLKKQFFMFTIPRGIKDQMTQNEVVNLVNKAYNDGYLEIIERISKNISSQLNKNDEQKRLEILLKKYQKYLALKTIKNLPDRYVNNQFFSVEVPNEY
jgi:hypothetical protein